MRRGVKVGGCVDVVTTVSLAKQLQQIENYIGRVTRDIKVSLTSNKHCAIGEEDGSRLRRRTGHMINDVKRCATRQHGSADYFFTEMVKGHGYFRQCLHRFGHNSDPFSTLCPRLAGMLTFPI